MYLRGCAIWGSPAENAKPRRNYAQSHSTTFKAIQRHLALVSSQSLIVFAAMAAPAPAKLTSVDSRHLGAKSKPINTFFKLMYSSEREASAKQPSSMTKPRRRQRNASVRLKSRRQPSQPTALGSGKLFGAFSCNTIFKISHAIQSPKPIRLEKDLGCVLHFLEVS